jgi:hypothetical protein
MVKRLAIYVCLLPGCAKITMRPGNRCPEHDKLMVRETYTHDGVAPGLKGSGSGSVANILTDLFKGGF